MRSARSTRAGHNLVNEHVLGLLEFPKVCEMVAARTHSVRGRESALRIRPSTDRSAVEQELDHTRQLRILWIAGREPGPVDVGLLDALLGRLHKEGELLESDDLMTLGRFLATSTRIRASLVQPEILPEAPDLYALGQRFSDFGRVVRQIESVFDPSGEMLDSASPRLSRIRRRLRESRLSAGESLSEMARTESSHPEDSFVTLRDGRYVLAVRGSDRRRLPGIVHGHSKTGQTVYLEPMQIVERNNAIATQEAEEQEERIAILRELTESVQTRGGEIAESYAASGELDLLRARTQLSVELDCTVPSFNEDRTLRIVAGRHPLLAETARSSGAAVVPLDLTLTAEARSLVLSGPNMGGKTVALKTVGLLCAMAQAGLPVPADDGTDLPFLDEIFVDLGDEQSIEEETSTFAGHLRNIGLAWDGATDSSLVLLDELGGGTDPEEGTALGRALIELLSDRGCLLFVTTHLIGIKMIAHENPQMRNAAMEFSPETQRPTYRLRTGAPGRSRAFELARQILEPGELLERAEAYRSRFAVTLDELLGDLERRKAELQEQQRSLAESHSKLEEATAFKEQQVKKLRARIQALRESRWETESAAIFEAERLLAETRRLHKEIERAAAGSSETPDRTRLEDLRDQVRSRAESRRSPRARRQKPLATDRLKSGTTAWSEDLGAVVTIDSEPDRDRRVWITHGALRLRVGIASLGEAPAGSAPATGPPSADKVRGPAGQDDLPRQIDLRGKTVDESLDATEQFIDAAAVAGVPEIRIIHGKGTGTLKREIEAFLRSSSLVERFRTGEPREGGWGATIVTVRSARVGD